MHYYENKSLMDRVQSIHDIMFDSCGYFFIKDLKGKFIYLNKNLLDATGRRMAEFLGKTDYDSPWAKYGEIFARNDSMVLPETSPTKMLEITETHDKRTFLLLSHKKPFYHDGKRIGICGTSLEVADTCFHNKKPFSKDIVFFDVRKGEIARLTYMQKQVAFYLLHGLSAKEISARLSRSRKTIERHVMEIKYTNEYRSIKELLLSLSMV